MQTWPSTLPNPDYEGFVEQMTNNILRTSMDAGAPKQRRRFTAVFRQIKFSLKKLTSAQRDTLIFFYNTVGAGEFYWTDPVDGITKTARFIEPPSFSGDESLINANISIEVLP